MFSKDLHHIPLDQIIVDRAKRQRKNLDIGDLIPSIRARGVMHPILVEPFPNADTPVFRLVAGERRLETCKFLAHATIPARFTSEISPLESEVIELEENLKRSDLSWQDQCLAVLKIHRMYKTLEGADWTDEKTADMIGLEISWVRKVLMVAEPLAAGDQNISACDAITAAHTILVRRKARAQDETMNRIMEVEYNESPDEDNSVEAGGSIGSGEAGVPSRNTSSQRLSTSKSSPYEVRCENAIDFFSSYDGPKFNFLHVDFPYGVVLSEQAGQEKFEGGGYESSPEIYIALCKSLVENWGRILYPSAHVMFWISMNFYIETVDFFRAAALNPSGPVPDDLRINPTPLIWHKTDNRGILADPMRMPRNIYEAALIMSTGDRHLVKPVSNVYGAPTAKSDSIHTNEKPEPMLAHFFQLFVDQHSRVLDPTCGSGSSIRVAERLGAESALGLEINPEFAARASERLRAARNLEAAAASMFPSEPA